jgi:ketosteroid isomerase-like protein
LELRKLMMRFVLTACIGAALTATAFGDEAQQTRLTTNMLEKTSLVLDKAGNSQDAATLLAHMASNVVVVVTFPQNPEFPKMTFSKDEYAQHLRQTWARTKNVTIRRTSTKYDIADDGQSATATSTFRQTATLTGTGQTFVSESRQVSEIKLIEGVAQATRIDVTVSYK